MFPKSPEIKRILGRQYQSKSKIPKDRNELKKQIEALIPSDYTVRFNELTGYIYITKK